jgi:hypothetical protein
MTSTAIERQETAAITPFPGPTFDDILDGATDIANRLSDVIKQRRMYTPIGAERKHINLDAWQTAGAMTRVFADQGEVEQLPWPQIAALGDEPPTPDREPRDKQSPEWHAWDDADRARRAWELHRDMLRARDLGRAYGFKADFRAAHDGNAVGWGEGRCTRGEASKVNQEDFALASMAQTRAQSRALGAPLKFVVKLAGYETTPAEELDGAAPEPTNPAASGAAPWGPMASDEEMEAAAQSISLIRPGTNGHDFILKLGSQFDGVPKACVTMLRGLARYIAATQAPEDQTEAEVVS